MPPRKPISELTPEQAEARKKYMRSAKRKSRASGLIEKPQTDKRTYSDRAEYQRDYQRKLRAAKKLTE